MTPFWSLLKSGKRDIKNLYCYSFLYCTITVLSFKCFVLKPHRKALIFVMFTWQVASLHIFHMQQWLVWLWNFWRCKQYIVTGKGGGYCQINQALCFMEIKFWSLLGTSLKRVTSGIPWMGSPHLSAHLSPDSTPWSCQVCSELVLDRVGTGLFFFCRPSSPPWSLWSLWSQCDVLMKVEVRWVISLVCHRLLLIKENYFLECFSLKR